MPNCCTTSYVISGPKKDVRSLYDRMKRLQSRKESLLPNGFGKTWLGNLVRRLGADRHPVDCRSEWTDLNGEWFDLRMKGGDLRFNTRTAWSRCKEVEDVIEDKYPDLSVWFLSEELGCDIFETNDATGEIFPERVIIDTENEETEYYTYEEAHHVLCDKLGLDPEATSWEQAMKLCKERNDLQDAAENEAHIWVYEVELV